MKQKILLALMIILAVSGVVIFDNRQGLINSFIDYYNDDTIERAESGDLYAMFRLSHRYQHDRKGVDWLRKAAELGYRPAQNAMGDLHTDGHRAKYGIEKDLTKALKWYQKSAEQGDAEAQFRIAEIYEVGRGVPPSEDEAIKWYRKAAENDDWEPKGQIDISARRYIIISLEQLIKRYDHGFDYKTQCAQTINWWKKLDEMGAAGPYKLAQFYESADSCVDQDYQKALEYWYKGQSFHEMSKLYFMGGPNLTQNFSEAYFWCLVWNHLEDNRSNSYRSIIKIRKKSCDAIAGNLTKEEIAKQTARKDKWASQFKKEDSIASPPLNEESKSLE